MLEWDATKVRRLILHHKTSALKSCSQVISCNIADEVDKLDDVQVADGAQSIAECENAPSSIRKWIKIVRYLLQVC